MQELKIAAARSVLDSAHKAIASLDFERTLRTSVALPLLTASRDHGHSILLLIDTQPNAHGSSALALMRTQLDTLLRGCFFAGEATDPEIEFFRKKDEMPSRNGQKLSPIKLTPLAKQYLGLDPNDQSLEDGVKSIWEGLHGMVHGGRATMNLYNNENQIAFELTDEGLDFIITQSTTLTLFCVSSFLALSKQSEAEKQIIGEPILQALGRFKAAFT